MTRRLCLAMGLLTLCAPGLFAQADKRAELDDNYQKSLSLVQNGKGAQGLPYLQRAVELAPEVFGPDHPNTGSLTNSLGVALSNLGRRVEAEKAFRAALAIREKHAKSAPAQFAVTMSNLASTVFDLGRFDEAEPLYRRCLEIEDEANVAVSCRKLAQALIRNNKGAEVEPLLRRALAIQEKLLGTEHVDLCPNLQTLSEWKSSLGQNEDAERLAARIVNILEKAYGKDDLRLLWPYQALGGFLLHNRRFVAAEDAFRRALDISERRQGADHPNTAAALNNLSHLYSSTNRPAEALALRLRSYEISRKKLPPNHRSMAALEHNIGRSYYDAGRYDEAEDHLARSLRIAEECHGKDHEFVGTILGNLSSLSMVRGQAALATEYQNRVLTIDQTRLKNVLGFASEPAMFAYLQTRTGLLPTMLSIARDGDPTAQETACDWTLRLHGIVFDTICRYRQAQQTSVDDAVKKRLEEYRHLKLKLADVALNPPPGLNPEQVKTLRDDWAKQIERMEGDLNGTFSSQGSLADSAMTTAAVRSKLPPKSALVLFANPMVRDFKTGGWGDIRSLAFVVAPGQKTARLFDLGSTKQIAADVDALRKEFDDFQDKLKDCDTAAEAHRLEKTQEPLYRKKAAALYAKVLAPLQKELGDAELLYLVTDGSLNRLPFEALVDENGKYLAETRRCVYLSGGRDLLRPDETPAKGVVVFAGPDFKVSSAERRAIASAMLGKKDVVASRGSRTLQLRSAGWKALPGAAAEAGDIRETLSGSKFGVVKTHVGAEAMEEILKAMPPPRILHLATHGFYLDLQKDAEVDDDGAGAGWARGRLKTQDNPLLRSGIVLAGANTVGDRDDPNAGDDGWVTAEEIALLNLHGTELVVLSACQTGLGEVRGGEGVFGLRRAFLYAGARSLLTSLFEVPDTETRELMQRFYQGLKNGQSKAASLNAAQRAMIDRRRQSHGAAHPFYWASFVLIGDPR